MDGKDAIVVLEKNSVVWEISTNVNNHINAALIQISSNTPKNKPN